MKSGMEEPFNGLTGLEMLRDNLVNIFRFNLAIPNILWHDLHGWA